MIFMFSAGDKFFYPLSLFQIHLSIFSKCRSNQTMFGRRSSWISLAFLTILAGLGIQGINWNGNNWAMACDFRGNDLSHVRIGAELCGGKCEETARCTHFAWSRANGGTCWMKHGRVSKNDAFQSHDSTMVCGVRTSSQDDNKRRSE